jgi:hypothetical protein
VVSILLERAGLTVRPGWLEVDQALYCLSNVDEVDVFERHEGGSLIWAIYAALSVLALVQAAASTNLTLAILGVALSLFAKVAWSRRRGGCTFELVLSKNGEVTKVHRTLCRTEAWLMRDAVAMAMPCRRLR